MEQELGPDFHFEFSLQGETADRELRPYAEERLRELAEGHNDMIGAAVSVEEETAANTPHVYRARIVAYMRPDNVVAVEKDESDMQALKGALDAVERQIRSKREKLDKPWDRPATPQPPA